MDTPKSVHVGYGKYKTKQELEEAESNAWLALPLEERQRIMKEKALREREHALAMKKLAKS